ncbi:site-specific integrase [Colwellia sp. BRX8-9]|jgi:integrase|uniref:site-specific integrase n=1 Tax=Colwellia sp. BRX8-9 TaxID=2759831 RepID=UPI0015F6F502|nr:site-specific integrase [Colwellia sp. BRX8-9]MBA6348316.1 site-specific integrase [Colwellia sp. BRX8-9]
MTKLKFTDKAIKALPANDRESKSTELEVSDTLVQGLKCLVGKTGNKRFLFRYTLNAKKQSISLGRFGDINVTSARQIAQKHRVTLGEGVNPKAERDCPTRLTVNAFFNEHYLPSIKKRKKTWQDDKYRYDIMIAPKLGNILFRELRTIDVQKLHLSLTEQVNKYGNLYAPATCNQALMIIKSMSKSALNLGVIDDDVCLPVKLFRLNNARTRFLNIHEVKRLLKACREYSNRTISSYIALLALTGLRCSEIANIKVKDVDIAKRVIHIPITKNGKSRSVYLTDPMLAFIGRVPLKVDNPYLFAGKVKGKPLGSVRKTYIKLLKRAQVNGDDVCLHTLRHSVASNLVSAGVSLRLVQEQLAHKSIISTQRYAKLTTESMRQTSETLSNMLT